MDRYAVVVDGYHIPYDDSRGFASAFRERGVRPIAVMSRSEPLPQFLPKWFPDDFDAVHFFDGDFDAVLATVKSYDPICIVPGHESGVEFTAALVEVLMPEKGNVPGTAPATRDKGLMVDALARAGVPHLRTISSADVDEVDEWIRRNGLQDRPLVIKPPKSGGTDAVHLAMAGEDWRPLFRSMVGSLNDYRIVNDEIVVQEYAEGTEYIVDLYSVAGRHGLVDVCVYVKHDLGGRIGIYDVADFLGADDPIVTILAEYTKRAAHAVGIRNGSTHAEVMLTEDGPLLIELAARYSGSCMMLSGKLATGTNQIDLTVRHHLDGYFSPDFRLEREVRTLWLAATNAGVVRNAEVLAAARELPTVFQNSLPQNGQRVAKTEDMHTCLGWIIQAAADWPAIERDYRTIRELEQRLEIEPDR